MDGWWSADRLDELACRIFRAGLDRTAAEPGRLARKVAAWLLPRGRRARAFVVGERHYDIGNDLFEKMLDRRMIYSCAYWKGASTLDEAQEKKLDLVCRKVGLKPGQTVLDIGCGWGGFARFAAERYGVRVVGVTVSKEQLGPARECVRGLPGRDPAAGLPRALGAIRRHRLARDVRARRPAPPPDLPPASSRRCLADDGLLLLHTIARPSRRSPRPVDREVHLPAEPCSRRSRGSPRAAEGLFVVEDVHNFGAFYDRTLMAWDANVEAHRSEIAERYGERFLRMWRFYLLSCAGSFRARHSQLFQLVLSPGGIRGGYDSVR